MKSKIRITAILGIILFFSSITRIGLFGQEIQFKTLESSQDWDNAKSEALSSGKFIFMDIYASWCGPCKNMDANVFSDSAVSEYFNANFVNLKIDGESEFGTQLARLFKLTAYPSMYFINYDNVPVSEIIGYRDPLALIEAGKIVKESGGRFLELDKLFMEGSLTAEQTDEFLVILGKLGNNEKLTELASDRVKTFTEADLLNPANKAMIIAVPGDLSSFAVQTVLSNSQVFKNIWGIENFQQYLAKSFDKSMVLATESKDIELMERIAKDLVPVYMMENADRIPEAQLTTRKIYYSEIKDWDGYLKSIEDHKNEFQMDSPGFLYGEAYYIVENQLFEPVLLDRSNEWMEIVIAAQPDFQSYFLNAVINTYRKDNDLAQKWLKMAESVAKSQDEMDSLEQLRNFLNELTVPEIRDID